MKKLGILIGILLLSLATFAMDATDFEKNLTVHKLKNGLTFLIYERHEAPVVSLHTYVNASSLNERVGITGISHMLEHMAFKGTTTVGAKDLKKEKELMDKIDAKYLKLYDLKDHNGDKAEIANLQKEIKTLQEQAEAAANIGEFDQVISRNGSPDLNAFTTSDATQYHYSLPSNKVELFCFLESERFYHPVFRQFYKERNVVAEERRMRTESNPTGKLIEQFQLMSFTYHPYHVPTIGAMSDIQHYTRAKVANYFKKYYNPRTMTIAIVGDVNPKTLIPMLDEYFGRIPAGDVPDPIVTVEPKQTVQRRLILHENSQPIYLIGWHRPAETSKDNAVFDAISGIIGSGRSSRLYKKLVKEKKVAAYVGSFNGYPGTKYPNLFMVFAVPSANHSNVDVEEVINDEVEKLKTTPVTDEELQKVKTQAKAELVYAMDNNMGIAQMLANYYVKRGDWKVLFNDVDAIENVTAADIQRVAKEYLQKTNSNVGELLPKEQKSEKE